MPKLNAMLCFKKNLKLMLWNWNENWNMNKWLKVLINVNWKKNTIS